MAPTYWLDLFTGKTWDEFLKVGGRVTGFREPRWKTVQRMKTGDHLLCYLTGISRFVGVLEVAGEPFRDTTPIWTDDPFPARVPVRAIITLSPETAVPVHELRDRLSFFEDLKSPRAWTGRFRGSPSRWKTSDGEAVIEALREAQENPVKRPVDPAKLARRPRALRTKIGSVTVPQESDEDTSPETEAPRQDVTAHTETQWLLLKLGSDMGLDVWVARNDRNRDPRFGKLSALRDDLPLQFDEATNQTIELIDVLWLQRNSIVAAFEIESTTSIYSGLLRMADLIAMQPNLNIPLYIVAPDERRNKVIAEVNRPTFSRLSPPLAEACRYISFSTLKQQLAQVAPFVQHLKPDYLDELSESCEAEEV